jgi:hypothetical protein
VVDNIAEYYTATLFSAQDYYPFGMEMPGRNFVLGNGYRFGFNGQEASDLGNGQLTAKFWEYDARLGRRWNVDPVYKQMPHESPYAAFHNGPIIYEDHEGDIGIIGAAIGGAVGFVVEVGSQTISGMIQGKSFKETVIV